MQKSGFILDPWNWRFTLGKSLGGISVFSTFHGPLGSHLAQSLRHKVLPKTPTLATLLTPCIRAPVLVWMINVS